MALQFNPYPILDPEKYKRPDFNQTVTQPLQNGLQMLMQQQRFNADQKRQASLDQIIQQEQGMKMQAHESRYGRPIDPGMMTPVGTGQIARSSMMPGGQGQVGTGMPLREAFDKWRAGGMKTKGAQPEFMPALGEDERKQFYETANPKPATIFGIPNFNQDGSVSGWNQVPEGIKPVGGFTKPYVTPEDKKTQELEAKKKVNQPKEAATLKNALSNFDRMIEEAEDIKNSSGLSTASGLSAPLGYIPATKAYGIRQRLNTLKSKSGFQVLQEMRANSPTGGALGQVSDKENQLLQENLANLNLGQSDEDVKNAIDRIISYAQGAKQRLQSAYDEYYSGSSYGGGSVNNDPLGLGL